MTNVRSRPAATNSCRCLFLAFCALLTGCGQLTNTALPLHGVAGTRYETTQELLVCGIKRDLRSDAHDYIVLVPKPGIGGPEVIKLGTLPAGTAFEIIGLVQQGPEFLNRKIYQIKILGRFADNFGRDEVQLSKWNRLYAGADRFGQPTLSPDFFRRLP